MTTNTLLRPADTLEPLDVDERDYVQFDFTPMLDSAETLLTPALTCEVAVGTDAAASTRLSGAAVTAGAVVRQYVESPLSATYLIRCTAPTSAGRRLVLAAMLPVLRVGGTS